MTQGALSFPITGTARAVGHPVPSAQPVDLFEVLIDDVGSEKWLRFRFLAPTIGRGPNDLSFADVEADMEHLCKTVALPYMADHSLTADVLSIALLDRAVPFGQSNAEATQYIDVFRVSSGACVWEGL